MPSTTLQQHISTLYQKSQVYTKWCLTSFIMKISRFICQSNGINPLMAWHQQLYNYSQSAHNDLKQPLCTLGVQRLTLPTLPALLSQRPRSTQLPEWRSDMNQPNPNSNANLHPNLTCSTILCLRTVSRSSTFMATLSPVSVFCANFTLAKVPSPMVRPTSYLPTFRITIATKPSLPSSSSVSSCQLANSKTKRTPPPRSLLNYSQPRFPSHQAINQSINQSHDALQREIGRELHPCVWIVQVSLPRNLLNFSSKDDHM